MQVANVLERRGFGSVANLAGGILAWSRDIDPKIPVY
jgi:rhodanese-related sulfurtransferase